MSHTDNPALAPFSQREGQLWDALLGRAPKAPVTQLLGWTVVAIDPERGTAALEFPGKPEFAGPTGNVQGGILAAMVDSAMLLSLRVTFQEGENAVSAEMKINFIRPAKIDTLVGTGRVVRKGRSIAFLEGDLRDGAGELIATASATAAIQARR